MVKTLANNRVLRRKRTSRGFSLVEAIVAIGLLGVGISACLAAMAQMAQGESRAEQTEKIQMLAHRKLEEIIATAEYQQAPLDGDFQTEGFPDMTWDATDDQSGVENLEIVKLTIHASGSASNNDYTVTQLVYRTPEGATGAGAATPTAAGGQQP